MQGTMSISQLILHFWVFHRVFPNLIHFIYCKSGNLRLFWQKWKNFVKMHSPYTYITVPPYLFILAMRVSHTYLGSYQLNTYILLKYVLYIFIRSKNLPKLIYHKVWFNSSTFGLLSLFDVKLRSMTSRKFPSHIGLMSSKICSSRIISVLLSFMSRKFPLPWA